MTPETHGRAPGKPVSFPLAAATMLLAILLYDVMGAIIKHLSQSYPAPQLSMLRNLFGTDPDSAHSVLVAELGSGGQAGRHPAVEAGLVSRRRRRAGAVELLSRHFPPSVRHGDGDPLFRPALRNGLVHSDSGECGRGRCAGSRC